MKNIVEKTIVAVTTPLGEGGIGIVEVSGPRAISIVNPLFRAKHISELQQAESGRIYYGHIHDDDKVVDEVIVAVHPSAKSYTGCDLVEINCHGGILPVQAIVELLERNGAQIGTSDDLLSHAASHNRIDSIQREALQLLPSMQTKLGVHVLLEQRGGLLSNEIAEIQRSLEQCSSQEATDTRQVSSRLSALLETAAFGIGLCRPRQVVIIGAPNVGKSTLFNALLREERAIVDSTPGTTRDAVSHLLEIRGVPIELVDTAGMRNAKDEIERLSIEQTRSYLQDADAAVVVLDMTRAIQQEEKQLCALCETSDVVVALNKSDLAGETHYKPIECVPESMTAKISATTGQGIHELVDLIATEILLRSDPGKAQPAIFTHRQQALVKSAHEQFAQFVKSRESHFLTEAAGKLINCLHG